MWRHHGLKILEVVFMLLFQLILKLSFDALESHILLQLEFECPEKHQLQQQDPTRSNPHHSEEDLSIHEHSPRNNQIDNNDILVEPQQESQHPSEER